MQSIGGETGNTGRSLACKSVKSSVRIKNNLQDKGNIKTSPVHTINYYDPEHRKYFANQSL